MAIRKIKRVKGDVYYDVLYLGRDERGKAIQRRVSATTKTEVRRLTEEFKAAARQGLVITSALRTVAALVDDWLAFQMAHVEHRTYASYRDISDAFIKPALGAIRLRDLKPMNVAKALDTWSKMKRRDNRDGERLSARTVRYILTVLRIALNWGVTMRELTSNPAKAVRPPSVTAEFETHALDPEAFASLIEFARDWRPKRVRNRYSQSSRKTDDYAAKLLVAAAAGLRRGELCALRWANIDFEGAAITVQHSVVVKRDVEARAAAETPEDRKRRRADRRGLAKDKKLALKRPKGGKPQTIAVPGLIIDLLAEIRLEQATRIRVTDETPVFDDGSGGLTHPDTFGKDVFELMRAAEVPEVRLHDLRHTFGSWLAIAGVPQRVMQSQLRHSTSKMTEHYTSRVEPAQRAAADMLDVTLRQALGQSKAATQD